MRLKDNRLGKPCPFCLRIVDDAVLVAKKERMQRNADSSRDKAKANGNKTGRKKKRDDEKIRLCRKRGMSIEEIASLFNISTRTVSKAGK